MPNTFHEDYITGKVGENAMLPFIRRFFTDDTIVGTEGQFARSDFVGVEKYEMKTRNIPSTTSFIQNEGVIIDCYKTANNDVFLFNFEDNASFIRKEAVLKCDKKIQRNKGRADEPWGSHVNAEVYVIPFQKLTHFHTHEDYIAPSPPLQRGVCHIMLEV